MKQKEVRNGEAMELTAENSVKKEEHWVERGNIAKLDIPGLKSSPSSKRSDIFMLPNSDTLFKQQ